MNKSIITIIIAVVISLGIGFYGGVQYQLSQGNSNRMAGNGNIPSGFPEGGQGQQRSGRTGGGVKPVSGEITAIDSTSITIKTQDGGSKIVLLSGSTKINKTSEGSASDLTKGEQIMVIGSTGTDGTVTAQSISVGGSMGQGMAPGGQQPQQGN